MHLSPSLMTIEILLFSKFLSFVSIERLVRARTSLIFRYRITKFDFCFVKKLTMERREEVVKIEMKQEVWK